MNADFTDKETTVRVAPIRVYPRLLCVLLCVLCGLVIPASAQTPKTGPKPGENINYQINLALDFDHSTYTGTEKVRWINRGDHPTSTLFFHLYPNMRPPGYVTSTAKNDAGQINSDEPRVDVSEVHVVSSDLLPTFTLDDQETTLRVNLREAVQPNQSIELQIKFKGSIPEIDPDETG